jgi:hypothetical protein
MLVIHNSVDSCVCIRYKTTDPPLTLFSQLWTTPLALDVSETTVLRGLTIPTGVPSSSLSRGPVWYLAPACGSPVHLPVLHLVCRPVKTQCATGHVVIIDIGGEYPYSVIGHANKTERI